MSQAGPLTRGLALTLVILLTTVAGLTAVTGHDANRHPVDEAITSDGPQSGIGPRDSNAPSVSPPQASPVFVAVYPNPPADGDRGEYVRLRLPPGEWVLSDGETRVGLTGPARVTVTADPGAVETPDRIVKADLGLSNSGERLVIRPASPTTTTDQSNDTVETPANQSNDTAETPANQSNDTVEPSTNRTTVLVYRDAPEGSVWLPAPGEWRPAGLERRAVQPLGPADGTAFVLPDAPRIPNETLRAADDRLLLAGYTFGSERAVEAILAAANRGVRVLVLLEGGPVGGLSQRQARLLDRLTAANVSVRMVGGSTPRVQYHHAKYAVVDDTALVLTENWKPSGTGGASNRGWGVRLADERAAKELAAVFRTDWTARDAVPWQAFRRGRTFEPASPANTSQPTAFHPRAFDARATYLLTAPGNARSGTQAVIRTADHRIEVIQPTITRGPLVDALKRAARRGVAVRILLGGAWYNAEENRKLAESLSAWADETGAPLQVRLAEPGEAFETVHAKGLVVDDTVVVGSVNWTPTSLTENREVAVAVRDPTVAAYFRRVFRADWSGDGGDESPPTTLAVVGVGIAALAAIFVARRVTFAEVGV